MNDDKKEFQHKNLPRLEHNRPLSFWNCLSFFLKRFKWSQSSKDVDRLKSAQDNKNAFVVL